ncbi:RNA polymerase sigma factor [Pararobbsia alpina]|nr:RNA polymerase sigma factor [Pararobbsia alpina]
MTGLHCDSSQSFLVGVLVKHYHELVDYVRRRFGDQTFAHDVVQDVCVQLLRRPPGEAMDTPLAFLRHLSIHRAIDRWRADERHAAYVLEEEQDVAGLHADLIGEERLLSYKQTVRELEKVIQGLPTRCREVFVLHKIHEMTQDEVAAHLNISRNMVAKHLSRAMIEFAPLLRTTLQDKTATADAA